MSVKVKICGITRVKDALAAAEAGADMVGVNFWPGTPRCVIVERGCEIADAVRGRVEIVAVFVDADHEEILRTADALGTQTVQLHGSETAEFAESLRELRVIKAFRIGKEADLEQLHNYPAFACLLDARVAGKYGGTGRTFDWELARGTRERARRLPRRRILLAGGLTPENVAEAVRIAEPWGVDCAGGVETSPGIKDKKKILAFVRNARTEI